MIDPERVHWHLTLSPSSLLNQFTPKLRETEMSELPSQHAQGPSTRDEGMSENRESYNT